MINKIAPFIIFVCYAIALAVLSGCFEWFDYQVGLISACLYLLIKQDWKNDNA